MAAYYVNLNVNSLPDFQPFDYLHPMGSTEFIASIPSSHTYYLKGSKVLASVLNLTFNADLLAVLQPWDFAINGPWRISANDIIINNVNVYGGILYSSADASIVQVPNFNTMFLRTSGTVTLAAATKTTRGSTIVAPTGVKLTGLRSSNTSTFIDTVIDSPTLTKQMITINVGDNIQTVVDTSPADSIFYIKAGVHREQKIAPKSGNTFIGETGAILNGSRVLSNLWTELGSDWYTEIPAPTVVAGLKSAVGHCDDVIQEYPELLSIYDSMSFTTTILTRVAAIESLATGKWYLDYDTQRVFTRDDYRNAKYTVELGLTKYAFGYEITLGKDGQYLPERTSGEPMPTDPSQMPDVYDAGDFYAYKPKNVTIKNLVIEKYANPAQTGAIGYFRPGLDWAIEDNEVRYCHGTGIKFKGAANINGNNIHHNGQMGIGCGDGNTLQAYGGELEEWGWYGGYAGCEAVVQNNTIAYNRLSVVGINPGWEGGGSKFAQVFDLNVNNNYVHHNDGIGLWSDFAYDGCTYQNNLVEYNVREGIFIEISIPGLSATSVLITHNTVKNNGLYINYTNIYGGNIMSSNSSNVEISYNEVDVNASYGNGITLLDVNRNVEGILVRCNSCNVHHNDVKIRGSGGSFNISGGQADPVQSFSILNALYTTNVFQYNTYHVLNTSNSYWRWHSSPYSGWPPIVDWTAWQVTYSKDTLGTLDANLSYNSGYGGYSVYVPPAYVAQPADYPMNISYSVQSSTQWAGSNYNGQNEFSWSAPTWPSFTDLINYFNYDVLVTNNDTFTINASGNFTGYPIGLTSISRTIGRGIGAFDFRLNSADVELDKQSSDIDGIGEKLFVGECELNKRVSQVVCNGYKIYLGVAELDKQNSVMTCNGIKIYIGSGSLNRQNSIILCYDQQIYTGSGFLVKQHSEIDSFGDKISTAVVFVSQRTKRHVVKSMITNPLQLSDYFGTFGVPGGDNTKLNNPWGICADFNSNVYVCDHTNERIMKLNSDLQYISQYSTASTIGRPCSILFDIANNYIYIVGIRFIVVEGEVQRTIVGVEKLSTSLSSLATLSDVFGGLRPFYWTTGRPFGICKGFNANEILITGMIEKTIHSINDNGSSFNYCVDHIVSNSKSVKYKGIVKLNNIVYVIADASLMSIDSLYNNTGDSDKIAKALYSLRESFNNFNNDMLTYKTDNESIVKYNNKLNYITEVFKTTGITIDTDFYDVASFIEALV